MSISPSQPDPAHPLQTDPADFAAEVAAYECTSGVGHWDSPHYRVTYRVLGEGPPLVVVQGLASTYRGYAPMLNRLAGQFRTVIFAYPGEEPDDGARLPEIGHAHLVDDLFGLLDHLQIKDSASVFAASFGSTLLLRALHREPERFGRAVIQGGFARRPLRMAERWALRMGRVLPGTMSRLPFREPVLAWFNRAAFPPEVIDSRWPIFAAENGMTTIAGMAHRLDMLAGIDLRPILPAIPHDLLLIQGLLDRIVPRGHHEELRAGLPNARGLLLPLLGHQPHFTHPDLLAEVTRRFLQRENLDELFARVPGGDPSP